MSARIVLADDHTILRNGLRHVLERQEFSVAGEASNGREAIEIVGRLKPDIVIMDIAMPLLNGIEAAKRITSEYPKTAVLILSMHSDEAYILKALKAGARGYLLKDSAEALYALFVLASLSSALWSAGCLLRIMSGKSGNAAQTTLTTWLTARERELLQLVAELTPTKKIATMLGVSPYTVDSHRGNLMQKRNVHSIPELILYAVRRGIIS